MDDTNTDDFSIEKLKKKTLKILKDLEIGKISAEEASQLATKLDSLLEQSEDDIEKNTQN